MIIKKVLIIGSQGYLGSFLIKFLNEKGFDCLGIDTGFFADSLIAPVKENTIKKDARNIEAADLRGFDVCIQLAAISNDPVGNIDEESMYAPTREYAIKIARLCKDMDIQFIFPSSCSVYGAAHGQGPLTEEGPTNPQTGYSLNKLEIEQELSKLSDSSFSPVALRFGTVFGMSPRIRFDLVINMLCGMSVASSKIILNSDGEAWRPHLYIEDACEAIRCSIENASNFQGLEIFNIGRDDNNLKIIDVAKLIKTLTPESELTFIGSEEEQKESSLISDRKILDGNDTRTYKVSFEKAQKELKGYHCKWTAEEGVKKLLSDLMNLELDEKVFYSKEFYRLQQIEHLYEQGKVDKDLNWI